MKKRLSVRALKEYCALQKFDEVCFCTENQNWYKTADPCKLQMSFKNMLISENPSLVCLKSPLGSMCFDRVRYAEVNTDMTVLGTVIHVHCGGSSSPDVTYTLVAS